MTVEVLLLDEMRLFLHALAVLLGLCGSVWTIFVIGPPSIELSESPYANSLVPFRLVAVALGALVWASVGFGLQRLWIL